MTTPAPGEPLNRRSAPRSRSTSFAPWLVAAALFISAFLQLGALVSVGPTGLDLAIAEQTSWLTRTAASGVLDLANWIGQAVPWTVLLVLVAALLGFLRHRRVATLLIAGFGVEVFVAVAKALFNRPRPVPIVDLVYSVDGGSYPSGHVARVAVALGIVALFGVPPRWRTLALIVAAAAVFIVALARVASAEHWVTDVVGALLLAGGCLSLLKAATRWSQPV